MLQLRHVTCNMVQSHLVFAVVAPNLKGMKYSKGIQLKKTNSELNPYEVYGPKALLDRNDSEAICAPKSS